jgi:CCR4-NOT transcriptional complex subunit CAF120
MSWAAALRLSAWEKSRLEEIYTAHLIRINNIGAHYSDEIPQCLNLAFTGQDVQTSLIRGQMEGWVRIRLAGQTDWKRMWLVVTRGSDLESSSPGADPRSVSPSLQRKKRISNIFSRDREVTEVLPPKSVLSFYTSAKPKDKRTPILTMRDITQAFGVYPERPELISRSTLMKVEGMIGGEDTAQVMRNKEGWLLLMPELDGSSGQSTEMLKWAVGAFIWF